MSRQVKPNPWIRIALIGTVVAVVLAAMSGPVAATNGADSADIQTVDSRHGVVHDPLFQANDEPLELEGDGEEDSESTSYGGNTGDDTGTGGGGPGCEGNPYRLVGTCAN